MTAAGSTRTTSRLHTFRAAFRIGKDEEVFPAGTYEVRTTEDIHEGNEHTVYVRTSAALIVRTPGTTRHCEVKPAELDEAMRLDEQH